MTVAEGGTGDLFYAMNKEAAGDDLGLTLQTGFVAKALVGLFGSDRFRLAVSADGSTFFDGLSVDNSTGIVDQARLRRFFAVQSVAFSFAENGLAASAVVPRPKSARFWRAAGVVLTQPAPS